VPRTVRSGEPTTESFVVRPHRQTRAAIASLPLHRRGGDLRGQVALVDRFGQVARSESTVMFVTGSGGLVVGVPIFVRTASSRRRPLTVMCVSRSLS
jgi:hypothetical protein